MPPQRPRGAPSRFDDAFERFDRANAEDPHQVIVDGVSQPKELVYATRMTARLERFAPDASEPIRLAARCQHIRRWTIARSTFAAGRSGYRLWRKTLGTFHAETAAAILRDVQYDEKTVRRVKALLRKDNLKGDQDVQTLEDVACLVFLEYSLADFASSLDEARVVNILRKTWGKMTERGRAAALDLEIPSELRALVEKAIGSDSS